MKKWMITMSPLKRVVIKAFSRYLLIVEANHPVGNDLLGYRSEDKEGEFDGRFAEKVGAERVEFGIFFTEEDISLCRELNHDRVQGHHEVVDGEEEHD